MGIQNWFMNRPLVKGIRAGYREATSPHPFANPGWAAAFPGRLDNQGRNMTLDGFGPGAPGGDYGAEDWTDIYRRQGGDGLPNRNVSGAPSSGGVATGYQTPGDRIFGSNNSGSGGGNTGSSGGGGVNQYKSAEEWGRDFANSAGGSGKGHSIPGVYSRNAATVSNIQNQAFKDATPVGYGNLMEILLSGGKTDPTAFNRQIAANDRGTATSQQNVQGAFAQQGLQNSGLGMALQGAIGAGGAQRNADVRGQEAQLAEARKREDLNLFMQMVMNPATDQGALALNQYNQSANRDMQKDGAKWQAWAQAIGALA